MGDNKRRAGPNSFYLDEDEQAPGAGEFTGMEQVTGIKDEDEDEQAPGDIIEEAPEAFIPSFTIAPDEIPVTNQVHIPTEEEQKATIEGLYKKIGVKAKEFIEQPPQPMTPEREKFVGRVSLMGARIFSSVMMWGYSIFGFEYGALAPTVEQSQKMILPLCRIVARHSTLVGNISPDVDDIIESLTAMSDYAVQAMAIMQEIREDKALNNGRYNPNPVQARPSGANTRQADFRGYTPDGNEPAKTNGTTSTVNTNDLTGYDRYNYEMLRTLSERDLNYRARRSGRI